MQEQAALARSLVPIARKWNARLTVHGGVDTAAAAGADGVHLAAGGDVIGARTVLGQGARVGISIHSVAEARALDPTRIDYAIAGPAFETASKPGYGPALGTEGIREIVGAARVPLIAIGGITPERIPHIVAAGAVGVAVMGSVMRARDPGAEVRALLAALVVNSFPRCRSRTLRGINGGASDLSKAAALRLLVAPPRRLPSFPCLRDRGYGSA